jgi:flagellar motor switch protein FliM
MAQDNLLLQDEIDALLNSVSGETTSSGTRNGEQRIRPYDPVTQHRVIRDRLHAMDIINERFARLFRISLFNLIRRSSDITVESMRYQSYSNFSRNVPVPTNINLITMKPLRGSALVVFPPQLVFLIVDNLFGGDGRFLARSEGREFTATENRIIQRLLTLAVEAYQEAWQPIHPLQVSYLRSEMQMRFANITNSPNEIVVNSDFHLEVGNLSSNFQICIPYSMIEPLRDILTDPTTGNRSKNDRSWQRRMAGEIRQTEVELKVGFVEIPTSVGKVMNLKAGDVLPIELPQQVTAEVDGVPVLRCRYGSRQGRRALEVAEVIEHNQTTIRTPSPESLSGAQAPSAGDQPHE